MGRYLDILERADRYDINDINDKTPTMRAPVGRSHNLKDTFGRISRFCRTLSALEARCPELVETDDWQQAVADARTFISSLGRAGGKARLDGQGPIRAISGPFEATSDFPATLTIRRNWTHLAAARPTRCCSDGRERGDREPDWRHHDLSQAQ